MDCAREKETRCGGAGNQAASVEVAHVLNSEVERAHEK
jgi:hypothetical protein